MKKWIFFLVVIASFAVAFAKSDQGQGKGQQQNGNIKTQSIIKDPTVPNENPPGWEQGKKTGWQGKSEPPGLAKKNVNETPESFRKKVANFFDRVFGPNKN